MNTDTPIIFSDGTTFYDNLAKTYRRHNRGLFILAPSGAGKSHFVDNQDDRHWIDGDYLWPIANADLTSEGWESNRETIEWINRRSDIITCQAKMLGFWIIGSSNSFLKPDAIVIPKWDIHKKYIAERDRTTNEHGATMSNLNGVLRHREIIQRWKEQDVLCFESVKDAAEALSKIADEC